MAGSNKVLKEGEIVFRQGEPADSMYLIRKGTLQVYISKDNGEMNLATLEAGSIVGEMAFFDNKPRSASVRAAKPTEVTQISRSDFDKLLTQIPKWMVTMMQSLSGRLRTTNERVQKLEEAQRAAAGGSILPGQKYPFHIVHRTLRSLSLSLVRDGEKDGREHVVNLELARELWRELVTENPELFDKILGKLNAWGFIALKKNALRQDVICFVNRGAFMQLTEVLGRLAPRLNPARPALDPAARALLKNLVEAAVRSGYESISINLSELVANCRSRGIDTSGWSVATTTDELVKKLDLKVAKSGTTLAVRITPKEHEPLLHTLEHLAELVEGGLA